MSHLIDRLPEVRGRLRRDASLASVTWFQVGGAAEVMFRPADQDDLAVFLNGLDADIPVTVIGVGSNLLVRDGGIDGVVIRLGRGFTGIEVDGDTVTAGAAAMDANVAEVALQAGLSGMEFLCGIPGTIGGAARMNAGAYGGELKDIFVSAQAVRRDGVIDTYGPEEMGFSYRHCAIPSDRIFTSVTLRGARGERGEISARMEEIRQKRGDTQPVRSRTGGSTFANPDGARAWELIDKAGCRGLVIGDAQVSEQHCNFLINRGEATAADLENLGELVRKRVKETSGVDLRWEIRRIGRALPETGEDA